MAKLKEGSKIGEDEVIELERRLQEAEETLRAIREGEVDALVVDSPQGEVIYTLTSADYPYRLMIDEMNEGAVSVSPDSYILYSNRNFAHILGFQDVVWSIEDCIGKPLSAYHPPQGGSTFYRGTDELIFHPAPNPERTTA